MNNKIDTQISSQITDLFQSLQQKTQDLSPVMHLIAAVIDAAIDENFSVGGAWNNDSSNINILSGGTSQWTAWSSNYNSFGKRNPNAKILHNTGVLHDSIQITATGSTQIGITVNTDYSAIHQFGGTFETNIRITPKSRKFFWAMWYETKDDKWRGMALTKKQSFSATITIPPRPYIVLNELHVERILNIVKKYIIS